MHKTTNFPDIYIVMQINYDIILLFLICVQECHYIYHVEQILKIFICIYVWQCTLIEKYPTFPSPLKKKCTN